MQLTLALSSDGSMLITSAPLSNNRKGSVKTYTYNSNTYSEFGTEIMNNTTGVSPAFCIALSSNNNVLAIVFTTKIDGDQPIKSSIKVYNKGIGGWIKIDSDIHVDNITGSSISISHDGYIIAFSDTYAVYVKKYNGLTWDSYGNTIIAGNLTCNISTDGSRLIVDDTINQYINIKFYEYSNNVACFISGTPILTSTGYKPVETLTMSDLIKTSDNCLVTFKYYRTTIKSATHKNAPYLIPAHTFGTNYPIKDLILSPYHAIKVKNGVWQIPKYAALLNDKIKQIGIGTTITYYHIELPNYFTDNLVTDGTVVESYGAHQTKGLNCVFKFNATLNGFTRVSNRIIAIKHNL